MKKIRFRRVIKITILSIAIAIIQVFYDHLVLTSHFGLGTSDDYSLTAALLLNIISGLLGGISVGLALNYIDAKFRDKPYFQSLSIIVLVFMSMWVIRNIMEGIAISETNEMTFKWVFNSEDVKNILFWMIIVILTHFLLQMSNKFGPGKLVELFLGKYDKPSKEQRVFMLLDLKSSTTIAEQLGNIKYHLFLKKVFSDVTNPILDAEGEIYQYVGDEIVISWPINKFRNTLGFAKCFFNIQSFLEGKKQNYLNDFGAFPIFKAGAHLGEVTVGEIGVIKRDITYSGDILNTTSRIQGLCNELDSKLLISQSLYDYSKDIENFYSIEFKGSIPLTGKKEVLKLVSITNK